jgi:hypothetical protein
MENNLQRPGLCWRPSWFNPLESLWSILRKFVFLNKATMKDLRDFLGEPPGGRAWHSRMRLDLNRYGGFDPLLLQHTFGVNQATLDDCTVIPFIAKDEGKSLTSKCLRFCSSCLRDGFHSSLHQILLIRECPLHGEPLVRRCPHCQTEVDYTIRSVSPLAAPGCPKCVGMPETALEICRKLSFSSKERDEKFQLAAEFLRLRRRVKTVVYPASKWVLAKSSEHARERRICRLFHYWIEVVNADGNTPPRMTSGESYYRYDYRMRALSTKSTDSVKPGDYHRQLSRELLTIMKPIRRRLEKLWLGPHRNCAIYLVRRETTAVAPQRGQPCPYANILLLWRLYWHDETKLHHLLRRRSGWRSFTLDCHGPGGALPRELIHRIFAMECLAVLEECCLLVKSLRRHNQHTFNPTYLDALAGRRMPYWIVEHRPGNVFRLHVWKQISKRKSWSEINFPGVPKPSRGGKCDHSPSRLYDLELSRRRPLASAGNDMLCL